MLPGGMCMGVRMMLLALMELLVFRLDKDSDSLIDGF